MSEPTLLSKVKLALRISHTLLDSEITENIALARAEMVRAGVPMMLADDTSSDLVNGAIKTFCLYKFATDEKKAEGYFTSWIYQLDCLRKSGDSLV